MKKITQLDQRNLFIIYLCLKLLLLLHADVLVVYPILFKQTVVQSLFIDALIFLIITKTTMDRFTGIGILFLMELSLICGLITVSGIPNRIAFFGMLVLPVTINYLFILLVDEQPSRLQRYVFAAEILFVLVNIVVVILYYDLMIAPSFVLLFFITIISCVITYMKTEKTLYIKRELKTLLIGSAISFLPYLAIFIRYQVFRSFPPQTALSQTIEAYGDYTLLLVVVIPTLFTRLVIARKSEKDRIYSDNVLYQPIFVCGFVVLVTLVCLLNGQSIFQTVLTESILFICLVIYETYLFAQSRKKTEKVRQVVENYDSEQQSLLDQLWHVHFIDETVILMQLCAETLTGTHESAIIMITPEEHKTLYRSEYFTSLPMRRIFNQFKNAEETRTAQIMDKTVMCYPIKVDTDTKILLILPEEKNLPAEQKKILEETTSHFTTLFMTALDMMHLHNQNQTQVAYAAIRENYLNRVDLVEKERIKLTNFIHDDLIQSVFSLRNMIEQDKDKEKLLSYITEIIEHLRDILVDMSPTHLEMMTFEESIINLQMELTKQYQQQIELEQEIEPDVNLSLDMKYLLYRYIKELMTNVYKHAEAKLIHIRLEKDRHHNLCLYFKDDGKGVNYAILEKAIKTKHIGLLSIQQDLNFRNGKFELTEVSNGLGIKITIPDNEVT